MDHDGSSPDPDTPRTTLPRCDCDVNPLDARTLQRGKSFPAIDVAPCDGSAHGMMVFVHGELETGGIAALRGIEA